MNVQRMDEDTYVPGAVFGRPGDPAYWWPGHWTSVMVLMIDYPRRGDLICLGCDYSGDTYLLRRTTRYQFRAMLQKVGLVPLAILGELALHTAMVQAAGGIIRRAVVYKLDQTPLDLREYLGTGYEADKLIVMEEAIRWDCRAPSRTERKAAPGGSGE